MDYSEKLEGKIRINEVKKISQNDFQEEEIKIIRNKENEALNMFHVKQ